MTKREISYQNPTNLTSEATDNALSEIFSKVSPNKRLRKSLAPRPFQSVPVQSNMVSAAGLITPLVNTTSNGSPSLSGFLQASNQVQASHLIKNGSEMSASNMNSLSMLHNQQLLGQLHLLGGLQSNSVENLSKVVS
ncbi:hypothetical protein Ciccas_004449 [Cichlidogyrus casuarinus]|uniref:Uncharacterized protein n=1 Tax=Cichlidogyrus casuarinus TaxID=1844966 RepID=A0ABD2QBJ8_9PLAT